MSNPRLGAAFAVSALVLSLAACSSGSSSHQASDTATKKPMLGATFTGTMYVSTETTAVTKAFVDHVADVANCAAAAAKGDFRGDFKVPSPSPPEPQADIEIRGFHGPGTYPPAALAKDSADSILITGKSGTSKYVISSKAARSSPGKEVLFLAKNGSGQLVYSGAHLNGQSGSPSVAGLIQWSCKS